MRHRPSLRSRALAALWPGPQVQRTEESPGCSSRGSETQLTRRRGRLRIEFRLPTVKNWRRHGELYPPQYLWAAFV